MAEAAKTTAEIMLYGVIDEAFGRGAEWFAQQMKAAEQSGAEEIVVRINSAGGSAFEGIAIYNLLANASIPTRAVVDSLAASAASIVLQGADTREMRRGSFVMVHNPCGIVLGDARDMRKGADDLDALSDGFADIYSAHTGKDASEIREMMDAETWFGASDAVEAGFADEVLKNSRAKVAPKGQVVVMRAYRNLPEAVAKMVGIVASAEDDPKEEGATAPEADEGEKPEEVDAPAEPAPLDPAPALDPPPPPIPPDETQISAAYAQAVANACVMAGKADRISAYLESRTKIETVVSELLEAKCREQEATHVDGRKPAAVAANGDADPYNWRATLKSAGAYSN